jgi:hypothetical protein
VIAGGTSESDDAGSAAGAGLDGAGAGVGFHHAAGEGWGAGVACGVATGLAETGVRGVAATFRGFVATTFRGFGATRFAAFLAATRCFGALRRLAAARFAATFALAVRVGLRAADARRLAAARRAGFFAALDLLAFLAAFAAARGFAFFAAFFAPAFFPRLVALAMGPSHQLRSVAQSKRIPCPEQSEFHPRAGPRLDEPRSLRAGSRTGRTMRIHGRPRS